MTLPQDVEIPTPTKAVQAEEKPKVELDLQVLVNYAYLMGHRDCLIRVIAHPQTMKTARKGLVVAKSAINRDLEAMKSLLPAGLLDTASAGAAPKVGAR